MFFHREEGGGLLRVLPMLLISRKQRRSTELLTAPWCWRAPWGGRKALSTLFSVDTQCPVHTYTWDRGLLGEDHGNCTILN